MRRKSLDLGTAAKESVVFTDATQPIAPDWATRL